MPEALHNDIEEAIIFAGEVLQPGRWDMCNQRHVLVGPIILHHGRLLHDSQPLLGVLVLQACLEQNLKISYIYSFTFTSRKPRSFQYLGNKFCSNLQSLHVEALCTY